jgi:hypothetical protein
MTLYAGEQFRITTTAKEYDGAKLSSANVQSVKITILNSNQTTLIDEVEMDWDADEALWYYLWDTAGLVTGSYRYKVTVVGDDGKPSIEWDKVRLARQPSIVVP